MPLILNSQDFDPKKANATLIKIFQTVELGDDIYSRREVPPEFLLFAETKGISIHTAAPLTSNTQLANWKIVPDIIKSWNIQPFDEVRNKVIIGSERYTVLDTTNSLALLQILNKEGTCEEWMLLDDLEVIHQPEGGFRNEGE